MRYYQTIKNGKNSYLLKNYQNSCMTSIGNFIHWLFGLRGNESTNLGNRWSGASHKEVQNGQNWPKSKICKKQVQAGKKMCPLMD